MASSSGISRREALIAATLDCVAEGGIEYASVRSIAARAGVSQGLIRHYFNSKEELLAESYESLMSHMTTQNSRASENAAQSAQARLAHFVAAAVTPPVLDARAAALWAGFLSRVLAGDRLRLIHCKTYLSYRDTLQFLIGAAMTEAGRPASTALLRRHAIACNAVIDGLWLEGCALPEAFATGEIADIALSSVGAILSLPLERAQALRVAVASS